MTERVLILAAFGVLLVVAIAVVRWYVSRRTTARLDAVLPAGVAVADDAAPTVLYFWGENCAACPTQKRALDSLATPANVVAIDAARQPDLASWAGVMTVPSTVIVDRRRRLRAVNHGFKPAEAISRQLAEIA